MSMAEVPGAGPESEQKPFEPSWLIENEDEFKKLRKGEIGTVGKKIAMLHQKPPD